MNFGLYLINNSVIDQSTFLDALEQQYATLPPLIRVLRKELAIADSEIIKVVQKQDEMGGTFLDAVKQVLGQATLDKILEVQNNSIKTMGEILVENNLVDLVTIQSQVDQYLAGSSTTETSNTETVKVEPAATSVTSPASEETEVSQAAIDSMKEIFGADSPEVLEMEAKLAASQGNDTNSASAPNFDKSFFKAEHDLDQDFVSELVLKFNAKEIVDLSKNIKDLSNHADKLTALKELAKRFHTILGAAKLSGAKVLAESISVLESYIKSLDDNSLTPEKAENIYQFFSLLVKLRNHIEQEKSEKGFFDESARQNNYENLRMTLL